MITALQDVSNVSLVNFAPVRNRVDLSGEVRPLPGAPSAIVVLGAAFRPPLTYDASGRLESQAGLTTNAFPAALPAATEGDAANLLNAAANAFAPNAPNVAADSTTEQTAIAARLAEAALPDTRIVTPEPTTTAIAATAQAETVLTALNVAGASTVIAAPNGVGAPTARSADGVPPSPPSPPSPPVAAGPIADPAAVPRSAGAAIPGVTNAPAAPAAPARAPTFAREAGILTPDDMLRNPFYPAMAASLYLNAMTFRLQQSSAAELNGPADNVQMVGDVRAVTAVHSDRQGPADDFRNRTRTFA